MLLYKISISYIYLGIPLTTLHRDKKRFSIEGKLPEKDRVKDRTENIERLEKALKSVVSGGMSQYQAAKLYNIPKATMWRYVNSSRKVKDKNGAKSVDT